MKKMFFMITTDSLSFVSLARCLLRCFTLYIFFFGSLGCIENSENRFNRLEQKGDALFVDKKYIAALEVWEGALAIHPNHVGVHKKIGKTYLHLANLPKATEEFQRVIQLKPDAWDVQLELAKIQLILGDLPSAKASWTILQRGIPDNPAIFVFHGDLMMLEDKLAEAEQNYKKALRIAPQFDLALIKLAICYMTQNKMIDAKQNYEKALSLHSGSQAVLLELANFWRLQDNMERAEEYLLKAANLDSENLGCLKMLAEFYIGANYYEKASEILYRMSEKVPENRSVKKLLVEVMLAQSRFDRAGRLLDELSSDESNDIEMQVLKGKYHLLSNELMYAASHFNSVVEKAPEMPVAHYLLGIAYLSGGQIHLAQQSFSRALALDVHFSEAELALADIYYKKEEFDLSMEHAGRISSREPENFRAHLLIGNILLSQHQYDEAITRFEAAGRIDPEAISPLYYMALTAELSRQVTKALHLYGTLLIQHPELADAGLRYAHLLIRTGRCKEAKQFFEDIVRENPHNGYTYHILGEIYLCLDNTAKATAHFEKAIDIEPKLASSYLKLAEIYKKRKKRDEQVHILETSIANIPNFSEAYIQLADLYIRKNTPEKAISILNKAIAGNPASPVLSNNLAWMYLELDRDTDQALSLAQSAYEQLPEDPVIGDTLGWAYYKKGLFRQAVWYLTEARSRKPDHPIIHFHLGMVYYAQGNKDDARKSFKKALVLQLEGPKKIKVKELLKQMS